MQRVRLNQHALELNRLQQLAQRLGSAAGIGGVGTLGNRDAQDLGIEANLGNDYCYVRVGFSAGAPLALAITNRYRFTRPGSMPWSNPGWQKWRKPESVGDDESGAERAPRILEALVVSSECFIACMEVLYQVCKHDWQLTGRLANEQLKALSIDLLEPTESILIATGQIRALSAVARRCLDSRCCPRE
jgi:hypothetical protein